MAGFLKVFPPTYYRDRFSSWDECNRFSARMFEDVIVNEDPETVAAVIVEPIGNTGGIITPTDEYYHMLREICDRYNVALIFDEIITGFARTGSMFAAGAYGVTPDIICSGKGLSSGALPLGAMIARSPMADAFYGDTDENVQFAHGHTYAGNPLGSAVGIAVIEEIVENRLSERAVRLGDRLTEGLNALRKYGVVRDVRGKGVLRGVEFVRDTESNEPFPELGTALKKTALANGVILRIDPSWFAVAPALIASEGDIDELCALIDKSVGDALEIVRREERSA
jgi:adenosylmethionine-8-amino-7-oxononanoate aminotransferase